jgi:hypothetical protein
MIMARKKVLDLPEDVRAYFSAASARRLRSDRPCENCGAIMRNAIMKRRFCSNRCSQVAKRQRQRAAREQGG